LINASNAIKWNSKGNVLIKLGRYQEVIECYDKALKIYRNYADGWSDKGNALNRLGRYQEAIECYDKALTLDPSNRQALDNKHKLGFFDTGMEGLRTEKENESDATLKKFNPFKFRCNICHERFKTGTELTEHALMKHIPRRTSLCIGS
jgi:tetratricopeptide (TPR) repeat protein